MTTRISRHLRAAAIALSALALVPPAARAAAPAPVATITYLTTSTVYVDAGTESGIRKGDVVKVYRDGAFLTALEVIAVTSTRASCRRADPSVELVRGDEVRFRAALPEVGPGASLEPARDRPATRSSNWRTQHGVRGRIGLRYLGLFDHSDFGEDYSQPALDFRLQANPFGHAALRVESDVRTRRTYRSPADGDASSEGRTRVYRMMAEWAPPDGAFRARAGRQTATALTSIGIFDGAAVEYGRQWRVGAFTGTQPDAEDFGLSGDVREHGVWLDWRDRPEGPARWRATTGLVGSYENGRIHRENAVFQARYTGPRLFLSATQDVDINRGWKRDAGEDAVSLTSSFVTARYSLTEAIAVDGGVDTRRSIRLYRDAETPETEFDDSYRQGYWTGVTLRPFGRTRVGLQVRRTTGGSAGHADTGTLTTGAGWPALRNLRVRTRSTAYENDLVTGWLHSFSVGADVTNRLHGSAGGGFRDEAGNLRSAPANDIRWYSADLDYRLTRGWFLLLSLERTLDETEGNEQVYASALYRF